MIATITSSSLSGSVSVPPSKSAMQRACALALLNEGETIICNPGHSEDDVTALKIIEAMGARVEKDNQCIRIISTGEINPPEMLNCNESGLSLRMFTPIVALSEKKVTLTGTGSLLKRHVGVFNSYFADINVQLSGNDDLLPITIQGPLQTADIAVDGSKSSQYLTGLLFAFAKKAEVLTVIHVRNLVSRPYIDLSLHLLRQFGYKVDNDQYQQFLIYPTTQLKRNITYTVEGDWSSASFFIVAALIAGDLSLSGLDMNSCQSDKKILDVLDQIHAGYSKDADVLKIKKSSIINAFEFDATDCPDLFPPLVVLALAAAGNSVIKGVSRLFDKESNRAETLMTQFSRLRAEINIQADEMIIKGGVKLRGGIADSQNDHRIAMALSIAALITDGAIEVINAESVNKSFPDFFQLFKNCGGIVTLSK